jgi:hypothetical protein
MQLVIDLYFLSMCIQLYMFRASSAHHQESLTVHTASSFCVCVRPWHCLVRNCNKTCRDKHLEPSYINIKINGNNRQCRNTKKSAVRYRINQKIKFMYIKEVSYKTVPRTDTNTETGGCTYSEGLLMMSA